MLKIKNLILLNFLKNIEKFKKFNNNLLYIKNYNNFLYFFSGNNYIQTYIKTKILIKKNISFGFEYTKLINFIRKNNKSIKMIFKDNFVFFINKNSILKLNTVYFDINKININCNNSYIFKKFLDKNFFKYINIINNQKVSIVFINYKIKFIIYDKYRMINIFFNIKKKYTNNYIININYLKIICNFIDKNSIFYIEDNKLGIINKNIKIFLYIKKTINNLDIKYNTKDYCNILINKENFLYSLKELCILYNKTADWIKINLNKKKLVLSYKNFDYEKITNLIYLNSNFNNIKINLNLTYLKDFFFIRNFYKKIILFYKNKKELIKFMFLKCKNIKYYLMPVYF
ncbi:hypothetical protein ACT2CR_00490 [Candidatus Vidania fulgoroideorum]